MTAIPQLEADIQSAIMDLARWRNWMCLRLNAGGIPIPGDKRRFVRLAEPGTPDLLLLGPGGQTIFCEVKRPGKKPTTAQAEMHAQLRALGHRVIVATSVDDVQKVMEEKRGDGTDAH